MLLRGGEHHVDDIGELSLMNSKSSSQPVFAAQLLVQPKQ